MGRSEPKFELPPETVQRIHELVSELDEFTQVVNSRYARQPQRWKNSDAGVEASAWIEDVEAASQALEDLVPVKIGSGT